LTSIVRICRNQKFGTGRRARGTGERARSVSKFVGRFVGLLISRPLIIYAVTNQVRASAQMDMYSVMTRTIQDFHLEKHDKSNVYTYMIDLCSHIYVY